MIDFANLPRAGYYNGRRGSDGVARIESFRFIEDGKASIPINPRFDLRQYSGGGVGSLEWGIVATRDQGFTGRAQLALAILCHAIGDAFALVHHVEFEVQVIATMPREKDLVLMRSGVIEWAMAVEGERR